MMRKEYSEKSERASGDLLTYFIIHNSVSVLFFFIFTLYFGIYIGADRLIGFVLQKEFWELAIFQVFPICVISSLIGRIIAFYALKGYHNYRNRKRSIKRTPKKWSELNTGINKLDLTFFISALFTSFIFSLGLISILQFAMFNEKTLLSLIVIYVGVKIGIHYSAQYIVGAKL